MGGTNAGGNEALVIRVNRDETVDEFRADLIGCLLNGRADGDGDIAGCCARLDHRRNGRFKDSPGCPFPPGMGRADNPGGSVGEQHRHAIRRQNAERNARRGRDKGVRRRIVLISPRLVHGDRNGGMDLIDRQQRIGRQAEAIRDPAPIRQHMARIIGGAVWARARRDLSGMRRRRMNRSASMSCILVR